MKVIDPEIDSLANMDVAKQQTKVEQGKQPGIWAFGWKQILYRSMVPFLYAYILEHAMQCVMIIMGITSASQTAMHVMSILFIIPMLYLEYNVLGLALIPYVQELNKFCVFGCELPFAVWLILVMGLSAANQSFLGRAAFVAGKTINGDTEGSGVRLAWARIVEDDPIPRWATWLNDDSHFAIFVMMAVLVKSAIGILLYFPYCIEVPVLVEAHATPRKENLYHAQVPPKTLASDNNFFNELEWTFRSILLSRTIRPAEAFHQVSESIMMQGVASMGVDYRFVRVEANKNRNDLDIEKRKVFDKGNSMAIDLIKEMKKKPEAKLVVRSGEYAGKVVTKPTLKKVDIVECHVPSKGQDIWFDTRDLEAHV